MTCYNLFLLIESLNHNTSNSFLNGDIFKSNMRFKNAFSEFNLASQSKNGFIQHV